MPCKTTYYPNGLRVGSCLEIDDGTDLSALFKKQSFTSSGSIDDDTNLAVSDGTNTLTMPLTPTKGVLETKSKSGTATLDAGSNTFESTGTSTETVTNTVNREWNLDGSVWIEL